MRRTKVISLATAIVLLLPLLLTGVCTPAFGAENPLDGPRLEGSAARYGERNIGNPGSHRMGLLPSRPDPVLELDASRYMKSTPLKSSVDLTGTLPPIGDQGNQGSCVGWATSYYLKTWWEKREHPSWNLDDTRYVFSPAFVYNQINGGQDQGAFFEDAFPLLENSGDVDIEEFPYDDLDYTTQPSATEKEAAKQYRIPGSPKWGYLFTNDVNWGGLGPFDNSLTEVKSLLDSGRPLVFGIPIFSDFPDTEGNPSSPFYDYGGWNPDSDYLGGHAVYIAGYDDSVGGGEGGFLMVNSWGSGWNGNGQLYLSYEFARKWVWEAWFMDDSDSSPTVTGVSPQTAGPGAKVTIKGTNLGCKRRSAKVVFSGSSAAASVSSWSNGQVEAKVPAGAATGDVYVYAWDGERSNGKQVTVDPNAPVPIDLDSSWLLAEGATWPGFDEWVLVMNPNDEAARVQVTFLTPEGQVDGPALSVASQSRLSIHVNDFVPNRDVATVVTATNGVQICAERAMYVSTADGKWGSHDSIASPGTSSTWYLAEGATWPGFDEWVLVMNPNPEPVEVEVSFQTPGGQVNGPRLSLAGGTRGTVHVNDFVPNQDVSTKVNCLTSGAGVVAERSMYVRTPDGKVGCHNSLGLQEAAEGWGLAEGATWPGYEEWVLVQNPTGSEADVVFYFLTPDEVVYGPEFTLAAGRRASVRVNDYVPDRDVSTMVFTWYEGQKVVVERAMYVRSPDGKTGAHNAPATAYACTDWYLPEGCTLYGFDEWVLVMNPDAEYWADVRLTFLTPGGPVNGPSVTLPPVSRVSFNVNDYVSGDVATKVESDGYVVCERSVYADGASGKAGAHSSMGVLAPYVHERSGGFSSGRMPSEQISNLRSAFEKDRP